MTKKLNQAGMASIMFAIFMVIILSLLGLGFAKLVGTDQRQILDKTLSNQAQYAAESATNRVANKLQTDASNGTPISPKVSCDNNVLGLNNLVNAATDPTLTGIEITCVKWSATPTTLSADNVDNAPAVFPLDPSGVMTHLEITWQPSDTDNFNQYPGTQTQLTLTDRMVPTLRIALGQRSAISNTSVLFAVPTAGAAGTHTLLGYSLAETGGIASARCTGAGTVNVSCNVRVALPLMYRGRDVISISSLKGASNLTLVAFNNAAPLTLANAQAQIDITAKSQDVIKRLVTSVSLLTNTWHPGFAASASKELCKNYKLDGGTNALAGPAAPFCGVTPLPVGAPPVGTPPIDIVDVDAIGGGGPGFPPKSKATPKWNLAVQIIAVSYTPTFCTYELSYRDTDGRAPNNAPWNVTFTENNPANCAIGNSHRFYFGPSGFRCDSNIGTSRCGLPGTYDIVVTVFGPGGIKLSDNRGPEFYPYSPYP